MKRNNILLLCLLSLQYATLWAQEPPLAFHQNKADKPLLFSALPEKFNCVTAEITKIFSFAVNETFSLQLSDQFLLKGKIVNKIQPTPGTISINIQAQNYDNALFNISIRFLATNSISVRGRILHPRYGDVLILTKENDNYYFKKTEQRLYMPE